MSIYQEFKKHCSIAEPIHNEEDYRRVKKWVVKVSILEIIFTVIAIIFIGVLISSLLFSESSEDKTVYFMLPLLPLFLFWICWGYATFFLYLPLIFKRMLKYGTAGYEAGKQIKTTNVQVTHEYGDNYKVSSSTDDKGVFGALLSFFISGMVWCVISVGIGSFWTFKKFKNSIKNLRAYSQKQ